jgi:hypothetical protein
VKYGTSSLGVHVTDFLCGASIPASSQTAPLTLSQTVLSASREFAVGRSATTPLDMLVVFSFAEGKRMLAFLCCIPTAANGFTIEEFDRVISTLCTSSPLQLRRLETTLDTATAIDAESVGILVRIFEQGASTSSRKQVVPILDQCIATTLA